MSKKLTILSAARRLPRFTVTELGDRLGIPSSTVQTVLNRVPESWFVKSQLQSGARGGQPKCYEVSDDGRQAIDSLLAALGVAPTPAPGRVAPEAPLGLLAAEEIRQTLETADRRAVAALLVDASANLDWAEDELREGLFATHAASLRRRMSDVREQLRAYAPQDERTPVQASAEAAANEPRRESIFAIARDRIAQWSNVLNHSLFTPAPPYQVVIDCLGSGAELRNLAVVACAALNGAAHATRSKSVDCVVQSVALEEIDTTFMDGWADESSDANQGQVWCINSAEDDGSIQRMLAHRKGVHAPRRAVVLDLAFSPAVETVAQAADVAYAPYAGDGRSTAWVSNLAAF